MNPYRSCGPRVPWYDRPACEHQRYVWKCYGALIDCAACGFLAPPIRIEDKTARVHLGAPLKRPPPPAERRD